MTRQDAEPGTPHTMTTRWRFIEVPCSCRRGKDHEEEFYDVALPRTEEGQEVTGEMVLDLPMPGNDADASTVREYLVALVAQVWAEQEGFSGKRPFGNSGWDYDLIEALWEADLLPGRHPAPGYGHTVKQNEVGDRLIRLAIKALASPSGGAEMNGGADA